MSKEDFLKKLNKYLKYLKNSERKEELKKYYNLSDYNLNPIEEANKIYAAKNIKIKLHEEISFITAINEIIEIIKSKNKKAIIDILIYILYIFLIIIIVKIPFIYTRDMILNLFNNIFNNDIAYLLWNLIIEIVYAISGIIIFINLLKNKIIKLKKDV